MVPSRLTVILLILLACASPSTACTARPAAVDRCSTRDAPSLPELSRVHFIAPFEVELNSAGILKTGPSVSAKDTAAKFNRICNSTSTTRSASPPSELVGASNLDAAGSSSSNDLLTTLSVVVLFNNLMPRLSPAWALATTAAAWMWLAFKRLQPWLAQTSTPMQQSYGQMQSSGAMSGAAAAGSDALAAAAGLSPAAAAAAADTGMHRNPGTRWWQHALLFLELFAGNAAESLLLMGLLLLPFIALRRWVRGQRLWGSMAGFGTPPTANTPTAATAAARTTVSAVQEPAGEAIPENAFRSAARNSLEGFSSQLQSAGHSAARLALAMKRIGKNARRRDSLDSNASSSSSSTPSSGSGDGDNPSPAQGSPAGSTSSSTGSMVSPEQSYGLVPTTPPLMYVAHPEGPLGAPSLHRRLAAPLQPSPINQEVKKGRDAAGAAAAAAAAAAVPGTPAATPNTWSKPQSTPSPAAATDSTKPAGSASHSSSSSDISTAARGVTRVTPADSDQQGSAVDAVPAGAHTDGGSSVVGGASLNLGTIGTIRGISTRVPLPPMYPTRSLYNSPLETVVISCKLANTSNTVPQLTAQQQYNTTAAYTGPFTATVNNPTAVQVSGSSGSTAGFSTAGGLGVQGVQGVQVPLSPAQASLGQGGHGSSISAQRELRAVVEAAVREAVAASNVSVLSTTVTSFPGCVHVVATVNLAAVAAAAAEAVVAGGTSKALADQVVWQQIVQQIIQGQQQGGAGLGTEGQDGTAAAEGVLARESLCLQHLLVQDTAGNVKYLWISPGASDSTDASPAGADMSRTSVSTSNAASEVEMPVGSSSGSARSSSSSVQTASSTTRQLFAAAEGICLSSYSLATDTVRHGAGDLPGVDTAVDPAAPAASILQLPVGLADALVAAGAGLRIVLSGTPQAASHSAAASDRQSPIQGPHLQAPYLGAAESHASTPAHADSSSRGDRGSVSLSENDDETMIQQQQQHLLADITLWPGSSSWPEETAEFDVLQLLPAGATPAVLAEQFGPVLTLNIVASTGRTESSVPVQSAHSSSGADVDRTSGLEMQGPAPVAVTGQSAADVLLATLAAQGAAEGAEQGVLMQDPAALMQDASGTTPRTVSEELQRQISQLVARLNTSAASGTPPTDADLTLLQPNALEAAAAAVVAAAAPAPATDRELEQPQQQQQQQQQALTEHLLLQLPLLLLPSSACEELTLLQQRMVAELGASGTTAAAAQRHMVLLIKDIAAAFNMAAPAQHQLDSTPAPTATPAATQGLAGVRVLIAEHRTAVGLQPVHQTAANTDAGVAVAALSTEQKHMLKQLLQFLSDQEMDTLAAALCSHLLINDPRQLAALQQQQLSLATAEISEDLSTADVAAQQAGDSVTLGSATQAAAASEPEGKQHALTAAASFSAALAEKAGSSAEHGAGPEQHGHHGAKQAAKALEQASAAQLQAAAAQRAAAATESALQLALQQISALSEATAAARQQAADAEVAAAAATDRAAAVEQQSERQRALSLISSPAGGPSSAGNRGVGIWGLLGGSSRAVAAARAAGTSLLGGVMRAAEPPMVPQDVSPRDVLLGFEDERLEVQYRRMKALQCRSIDRAALLMQLFRQAVYVWRIARLMYVAAGTGLSLVLLCKYEAVVLLPYVMMLLTPDFYIYHRHLLLCLSHIAAALTVGMIATTEVYRNEWSALLHRPGPTLLARPSMMLFWYYLLVPILQQQTLPEQALTCAAQLAHSLLIYVYILKGSMSLWVIVSLLLGASGVSFAVTYVADAWTRRQAVAGARRTLMRSE